MGPRLPPHDVGQNNSGKDTWRRTMIGVGVRTQDVSSSHRGHASSLAWPLRLREPRPSRNFQQFLATNGRRIYGLTTRHVSQHNEVRPTWHPHFSLK
ncbi:hypothetical protein L484_009886 [Morus notabilis]|uniref:Uncharacterized protein n=1 Tax=Morus notabilis TaxID=981085 RepID=W9RR68_9ROSA|nr:hypothetical protein L484_009886 [Morus notabilis]